MRATFAWLVGGPGLSEDWLQFSPILTDDSRQDETNEAHQQRGQGHQEHAGHLLHVLYEFPEFRKIQEAPQLSPCPRCPVPSQISGSREQVEPMYLLHLRNCNEYVLFCLNWCSHAARLPARLSGQRSTPKSASTQEHTQDSQVFL